MVGFQGQGAIGGGRYPCQDLSHLQARGQPPTERLSRPCEPSPGQRRRKRGSACLRLFGALTIPRQGGGQSPSPWGQESFQDGVACPTGAMRGQVGHGQRGTTVGGCAPECVPLATHIVLGRAAPWTPPLTAAQCRLSDSEGFTRLQAEEAKASLDARTPDPPAPSARPR